MIRKTWLRFVAMLSGLMDDQARQVVEYLQEENRVLREQLRDRYGCRRVRLNNMQRRRSAAKGRVVSRHLLEEITHLFSPETLLKWFRQLIAAKYDGKYRASSRSLLPGRLVLVCAAEAWPDSSCSRQSRR